MVLGEMASSLWVRLASRCSMPETSELMIAGGTNGEVDAVHLLLEGRGRGGFLSRLPAMRVRLRRHSRKSRDEQAGSSKDRSAKRNRHEERTPLQRKSALAVSLLCQEARWWSVRR